MPFLLALLFLFAASCSSPSVHEVKGLTNYKQALSFAGQDDTKACSHYLSAADDKFFSLAPLALIRALEVCPVSTPHLELENAMNKERPSWLKEAFARAALQRAILLKDQAHELQLSIEVASYAHLQSEKTSLLLKCILLSEALKDEKAAATCQERIYQVAPRLIPEPKPEQYLVVAGDFRQMRMFDKAREYYNKVLENKAATDADHLKAWDGIRLSYKIDKKTDLYIQTAKQMAAFAENLWRSSHKDSSSTKAFYDAEISLARTLWTEVSTEAALQTLKDLEKNLHGAHSLAEINWLRGKINEEQDHFQDASGFFNKAAADSLIEKDLREKILWSQAWNLYRLKKFDLAITAFSALLPLEDISFRQARVDYWLAKSEWQAQKQDEARGHYQWLIQNDPLGYYGLLAMQELKTPLTALRPLPSVTDTELVSPFENPAETQIFKDLVEVGESKVAQKLLENRMGAYREGKIQDEHKWLALFRAYARAGQYQLLFSRLADSSPELRNMVLQEDPTLLFPQPYNEYVLPAAHRFTVPVELINSIMRQESSFNPEARSNADAFGLLQLIPEMAHSQAETTGIHIGKVEELYQPQINIPIGAAALASGLKRYKGQTILAVASYNASDKAVQGWLQSRFHGNTQEFIEDIPYEETRTYIKLVLRNYVFYARINSPTPELTFPDIFHLNGER